MISLKQNKDDKDALISEYAEMFYKGQYDLKNSPLNKVPDVSDNPMIRNPRPDTGGRQIDWEAASNNWDAEDRWWQTI